MDVKNVTINEKKAQEIINEQWQWIADFIERNNLSKEDRNQIRFKMYHICLEMAKWKDSQYKWHNVSEELPDKSKRLQIYICQIVDNNGRTKDPLLCRYFKDEFVNHITLESLHYGDNVIAWMELPKYVKND